MPEENAASNQTSADKMSASILAARQIRIGHFIYDRDERCLIDEDKGKQPLSVKSSELLEILLQHQQEYLPSAALSELLYQHQVVESSTLRQQIKKLRELLGDSANKKRFIETKSSLGYRLIAKVEPLQTSPDWLERKGADQARHNRFRQGYLLGIVLLLALWTVYYARQHTSVTTEAEPAVVQSEKSTSTNVKIHSLTHLKGVELYPALSPDNRWLIFSYRRDNSTPWILYIRDLESDLIKPLTQSGSDKFASWSADGKQIVFTRYQLGVCQLIKAAIDFQKFELKNQQKILDCNPDALSTKAHFWPDNRGIYYNQAKSVTAPYNIYSWSFEAERGWQMSSTPPSGKGDYNLKMSHRGDYLAVLRDDNWSGTGIWLYDTKTFETRLLTRIPNHLMGISWSADDKFLVYRNRHNQIIRLNIDSQKKEVVAEPSMPLWSPILLSGRERELVAVHGSLQSRDVEKIDFRLSSDKKKAQIVNREFVAESAYDDFMPAVSHDGKQLAWISNRDGRYQIWLKDEQGRERKLTRLTRNVEFTSLEFNRDSSQLSGTAGGAWFSYLLNENRIIWRDSKDKGIYENLKWRHGVNRAYLARQTGERWRLLEYDGDSLQINEALSLPAFMAIDSPDGRIRYLALLNQPVLWRQKLAGAEASPDDSSRAKAPTASSSISKPEAGRQVTKQVTDMQQGLQGVQIPIAYQLAYASQWSITNEALYFVSRSANQWRLFRLAHGETQPQDLGIRLPSSTVVLHQTSGSGEGWLLTNHTQQAETEIVSVR